MDLGFEHDAVLRRADIDALELVFGGHLALDEFAVFGVDFAHVLGDLAAQILVDLDDLQLGLARLALGLSDRGQQLPALAFDAGGVALERSHSVYRHQVFLVKIAHALELLVDQRGLACLCVQLRGQTDDFVLELPDALSQLRLLAGAGRAAQLEQLALVVDRVGDGRIARRGPGDRAGT